MLQLFPTGRHTAAVSIKSQVSRSDLNKDALYHFFSVYKMRPWHMRFFFFLPDFLSLYQTLDVGILAEL